MLMHCKTVLLTFSTEGRCEKCGWSEVTSGDLAGNKNWCFSLALIHQSMPASSAPVILFKITLKLINNSQNISWRFLAWDLMNILPSIFFWKILITQRYHQYYKDLFDTHHGWVKSSQSPQNPPHAHHLILIGRLLLIIEKSGLLVIQSLALCEVFSILQCLFPCCRSDLFFCEWNFSWFNLTCLDLLSISANFWQCVMNNECIGGLYIQRCSIN